MLKTWRTCCAAIALLALGMPVPAQTSDPLRAAVASALENHPEVSSRFNAYRGAAEAVSAARGAYWPRLDLNASAGQDKSGVGDPTSMQSLNRAGVGLSVTQLLWDGLGTHSDVSRLSHEQLARYFELLDTTEQVALEASRAHYNVMRWRRFVQLAEDNYVQHRYAYLQIQSRVKAGVARGVDLEQAGARLASAESTLSAEIASLYEATTRYQRIVGIAPPRQMASLAPLSSGLPRNAPEALTLATRNSAAISASIENMRSARALVEAREAAYQPSVEARLRAAGGRNLDGVSDQSRSGTAEIVLNWNLFRGGTDRARIRQQVNLLNQAADQRDRVCRETREVAAIAFNDIGKLIEQSLLLDRNAQAIEKARDAYRQQFDIGQRSLLDLLNAESERYSAIRAHANAEYDLVAAYARVHAALNQLGQRLGLSRAKALADEAGGWSPGADVPTRCEGGPVAIDFTDRAELDARAQRLSTAAPSPSPAPQRRP
jgi:outer membrane protein, adhesin transport system